MDPISCSAFVKTTSIFFPECFILQLSEVAPVTFHDQDLRPFMKETVNINGKL